MDGFGKIIKGTEWDRESGSACAGTPFNRSGLSYVDKANGFKDSKLLTRVLVFH